MVKKTGLTLRGHILVNFQRTDMQHHFLELSEADVSYEGVKSCSRPTQSRDIEENVKKIRITFTFFSISLDWGGGG